MEVCCEAKDGILLNLNNWNPKKFGMILCVD